MEIRVRLIMENGANDREVLALLKEVGQKLDRILLKEMRMTQQLDRLTTEVGETKDVMQSAVVLIQGLKAALDAAIASQPTDDGAALDALSDSLDAQQQTLAAAVAANTPATPAPPATP